MHFWQRQPIHSQLLGLVGHNKPLRKWPCLVALVLALALMTWANGGIFAPHTAYAANLVGHGISPVIGNRLPTTSSGAPSGTLVHAATCEQAPPQSAKDRATYTPAELARYGLPPRTPGEPFAKWAKIVRSAGKRVCDYTASAYRFGEQNSGIWDGNFADESTSGQVYTEADLDYYVSCINSSPPPDGNPATYAAWVGLGGVYTSNLVQTGTVGYQTFNSTNGWQITYWTWVENLGASDPGAHFMFSVNCGNHIYVKAWDSGSTGCMYVEHLNDGENSGNQCYGAKSDEQSGEAIVEFNNQEPEFAKFGSETFYGVGITDKGSYKAMNNLPHDYANLYHCIPHGPGCLWGDQLASTGPIQNDPGDVPYDQYAVNWINYH